MGCTLTLGSVQYDDILFGYLPACLDVLLPIHCLYFPDRVWFSEEKTVRQPLAVFCRLDSLCYWLCVSLSGFLLGINKFNVGRNKFGASVCQRVWVHCMGRGGGGGGGAVCRAHEGVLSAASVVLFLRYLFQVVGGLGFKSWVNHVSGLKMGMLLATLSNVWHYTVYCRHTVTCWDFKFAVHLLYQCGIMSNYLSKTISRMLFACCLGVTQPWSS